MTRQHRSHTIIPIREPANAWHEPTLAELLSDPIVEAVMQADQVDRGELDDLLGGVARTLQARRRSRAWTSGVRGPTPRSIVPACCL